MSQPAKRKLSSVARKYVMGITGLILIGFLVTHLLGNLLIYAGMDAFNGYSATLHSIHGFYAVELGLAAIFLVHIYTAITLTMDNRRARPVTYTEKKPESTWSSRYMAVTGLIVLVFLIVHVKTLRFGGVEEHALGVYGVAMDTLSNPLIVLIYVLGVIFLAPHLRHGIHSCLRSLGLSSTGYLKMIDKVAIGVAAALTIGFVSIPLWVFVTNLTKG